MCCDNAAEGNWQTVFWEQPPRGYNWAQGTTTCGAAHGYDPNNTKLQ
jgi:hypothetical protein